MTQKTFLLKKESKAQDVNSLIEDHIIGIAPPEDFIETLDTLFDHWLIYHQGDYSVEAKDRIVNEYRHLEAMLKGVGEIARPSKNGILEEVMMLAYKQ